jgi:hypothetical protein
MAPLFTLGLLTSLAATPLGAQVAWDAPFLVPPRVAPGWGLALLDPAGGDLGVLGFWRGGSGAYGLRGGVAEQGDDDLAAFAGVDFSGSLLRRDSDFPLDVDWIAGIGLGAGDEILISIPFGVTLGASFSGEGVAFGPYVSPRLILDAWTGDDDPPGDGPNRRRDSLDLELAVDFGLDVAFDPGWTLRFGATLGDREALAVGFAIH